MTDLRNTRSKLITIFAALGAGALLLHAFNPQPDPPRVFGIFGITPVDAIRLNVTNVGGSLGTFAPPCNVQFGFVNASGDSIKMSNVSIPDGHSASIALNFFEGAGSAFDVAAARTRINVRPVVTYAPPCFGAVSAEVVDAVTGRTNIYAMPEVKLPAPGTVSTNTATGQ